MNDRELETFFKSPSSNTFDSSSAGNFQEHNQSIFGESLSSEPQGMPSFEDLVQSILQDRSQDAEGSDFEDDANGDQDSTTGFLAPTNFSADQVVAHLPGLASALESGSWLLDQGTHAFEQAVESGALFAKDQVEALSDTVQNTLNEAWENWNDPDNSLHNALDRKLEETVEDANELANDVGRSEYWTRFKQRYNQAIDSVSAFTEKVAGSLGYGASTSDIGQEEAAVEAATSRLADNLRDLTQAPDFETTIKTAFGDQVDVEEAEELIQGIAQGKSGPEIEVIDGEKLEGLGAFGDGRIFISDEIVAESADNLAALDGVLLEEVGHYLDQELNDVDSPGDEGEIFARLAQKELLSTTEVSDKRQEDDHGILRLENQNIFVENAGSSVQDRRDEIEELRRQAQQVGGYAGSAMRNQADRLELELNAQQLATASPAASNAMYEEADKLFPSSSTLKDTSSGYRVEQWQQKLYNLGYDLEVDGDFGPQTVEATKEFQRNHGLTPDGIVGAKTTRAMEQSKASHPSYVLSNSGGALTSDSRVEQWQQALKDLGYPIEVDGLFGSETEKITRLYQQEQGLAIDGIVGPDTLNSLDSAEPHILGSDRHLHNLADSIGQKSTENKGQLTSRRATPNDYPNGELTNEGVADILGALGASESGFPATAADIARQELVFFQNGALKEYQHGAVQRVGDYWKSLGRSDLDGTDSNAFWSAAFISWVMKQAGAGDSFKYSALHSNYIADAVSSRKSRDSNAAFYAYTLDEYSPQVGDLVGIPRGSGVTFDSPAGYKSHADIVVAVRPGEIDLVGGNVSDSVSMKTLKTDSRGRILSGQKNSDGFESFVVLSNQLNKVTPVESPTSLTGALFAPEYPGYLLKYQGQGTAYDRNVELWQKRMYDLGWEIDIDGEYGPQSKRIALEFQKLYPELSNDGIVGFDTWSTGFSLRAKGPITSSESISQPQDILKQFSDVDNDEDGISDSYEDYLLEMFAPEIWLHKDEVHKPANAGWFITRSALKFSHNNARDHSVLDQFSVTPQNLIEQSHKANKSFFRPDDNNVWFSGSSKSNSLQTGFFLDLDDSEHGGDENSNNWVLYGHVFPVANNEIAIQYWQFYPYNHAGTPDAFDINHEGDWEYTAVRINSEREVQDVTFYRHGNAQKVDPSQVEWTGNRHVTYSARGSHAQYQEPTIAGGCAADTVKELYQTVFDSCGKGIMWDPLSSNFGGIVNLGEKDRPLNNQVWTKYSGLWGNVGNAAQVPFKLVKFTSGPHGPTYQDDFWYQP